MTAENDNTEKTGNNKEATLCQSTGPAGEKDAQDLGFPTPLVYYHSVFTH